MVEGTFQNFSKSAVGAIVGAGVGRRGPLYLRLRRSTTSHALVVSRSLCIFREPAGARKDPREMGAPTTSRKAGTDGDRNPEESKLQEHRAERV